MSNPLSVQTASASLPLLVLRLAGVAAAGVPDIDRSQAGGERTERNALLGLSALKPAAPRRERVRMPNAADVVALTLANEDLYR